ncbi:MAG: hypothetical protein HY911_14705, partial [Desulfobacterales bacterium]|nr:hypothetical protein [Desulfobacterales bacterium]
GVTLGAMQRTGDEIAVYDELINRFGDRPEAAIVEQVAGALLCKGITLEGEGRSQEAISAFDHALEKVASRDESSLTLCHVGAIVEKSLVLLHLGRSEEASTLLKTVLNRPDLLEDHYNPIMGRLMDFAAQGFESETLKMMTRTPTGAKMEPLIVALKMMLGQEMNAPQEVMEVAKDVVARIHKKRDELPKKQC